MNNVITSKSQMPAPTAGPQLTAADVAALAEMYGRLTASVQATTEPEPPITGERPTFCDKDADALEYVKSMTTFVEENITEARQAVALMEQATAAARRSLQSLELNLSDINAVLDTVPGETERRTWAFWRHARTDEVYAVRMCQRTRFVTGAEGPLTAAQLVEMEPDEFTFGDKALARTIQHNREDFFPFQPIRSEN